MKDDVYEPKPHVSENAYVRSMIEYRKLYRKSIENPVDFWSDIAKQFHWETPIDRQKFWSYNFDTSKGPVYVKWLEGATTNICYNLLDRNIRLGLGDKIAFYWWATAEFRLRFFSSTARVIIISKTFHSPRPSSTKWFLIVQSPLDRIRSSVEITGEESEKN